MAFIALLSGSEDDTVHDLEPLSLLMYNGGLYLLAHALPRKAKARPFTYRVESFTNAQCNHGKPFEYPAGFSPADHFKETFGLFNNGEALTKVVIEIMSPEIREYITQRRWTAHQSYDAATKTFTMRVRDVTEVRSWILGFGPKVRILQPATLRAEVEAVISEMSAVYKSIA